MLLIFMRVDLNCKLIQEFNKVRVYVVKWKQIENNIFEAYYFFS